MEVDNNVRLLSDPYFEDIYGVKQWCNLTYLC